jgi:DNA polymerase-1
MSTPRLFLFDGSALVYRSFFAFVKNPLRNSQGLNTSAAFGFTRDLLRILDEEEPDRVAVVFDVSKKSFRHEQYPEYKATRERMPDELFEILPWVDRIVDGLGVPRLGLEGYEGDDLMATLAVQGREAGYEVYLVTGDKDFNQLVDERIKIYNPWRFTRGRMGGRVSVMGPAEVTERYGIPPERFRDYLALVGDSSDNVPGVPGVGPKRAVELLTTFDDLDGVLERGPEEYKRKGIREKLATHKEQALLSRELVTLVTDAPVDKTPAQLLRSVPDRQALTKIFAELEFREYLRRFSTDRDNDPHTHRRIDPNELDAFIERLRGCDEFVFDLETTSLKTQEAEVVGMAFSFESGEAWYLGPTETVAPGEAFELFPVKLDFSQHLAKLKPILEDPSVGKGGQNVKYDMLVLAHQGIEVQGVAFDTLLESYLLDPQARTHGLDALALRYLGYRKIATSELLGKGKKRSMADTPDEEIFPYASEDADITFRLHQRFKRQLAGEADLLKLYHDVELPLLHVLARLERRGIKIDLSVLDTIRAEFRARLDALKAEIFQLAGEEFTINSPKQVGHLLFETLALHTKHGIKPKKTSTGALSTDHEVLEQLAEHEPLPGKILEYRGLEKLQGTYVDALPKLVNPRTGRVHTSFNQAVAATGRLSSSDPNLQNIPIRTTEGKRIRSAFVAGEEGWLLLAADYSQVELRILAHLSGDETMCDAFREGADVHRATAARIFDKPQNEVTSELRGRAKAINFGIIYGMGAGRLSRETGISVPEAREFITSYFEKYPKIKAFLDEQVELARQRGYAETLLGRRRPLPDLRAGNRMARSNAERMATNTPIQGSAADIIKIAMVRIDERLREEGWRSHMLLQVHDELVFETPPDEVDRLEAMVIEEMSGAFALDVPLKVDVGRGVNWLEAH